MKIPLKSHQLEQSKPSVENRHEGLLVVEGSPRPHQQKRERTNFNHKRKNRMNLKRLHKVNARRRRLGMHILSGNKWGHTLAPQKGPLQADIEKTMVYKLKKYLRKRSERIEWHLMNNNVTKQGLWVILRKEKTKALDRKFWIGDKGFTFRELQTIGKFATEDHLIVMEAWMKVLARKHTN